MARRKKILEDHFDGCGGDLSSISEVDTNASMLTCIPCCDYDTEDELSDDDHNYCMKLCCANVLFILLIVGGCLLRLRPYLGGEGMYQKSENMWSFQMTPSN